MPMRRPDWMNALPHEPDPYLDLSAVQAVFWWELRRPFFNFYVFLVGMASVIVMKLLLDHFAPSSSISTLSLISGTFYYGVAANICYTFGWITELLWRRSNPAGARRKAVTLYWRGLKLSCVLTTAPVWFALYCCL